MRHPKPTQSIEQIKAEFNREYITLPRLAWKLLYLTLLLTAITAGLYASALQDAGMCSQWSCLFFGYAP